MLLSLQRKSNQNCLLLGEQISNGEASAVDEQAALDLGKYNKKCMPLP